MLNRQISIDGNPIEENQQKSKVIMGIEQNVLKIEPALPAGMTMDQFRSVAMQAIFNTPSLTEVHAVSLYAGVLQGLQLGLNFGPLGGAYLYPRSIKGVSCAVMHVSYQGLMQMAYGTRMVSGIDSHVVHTGDDYCYDRGANTIRHIVPRGVSSRGNVECVYARLTTTTGGVVIREVSLDELEKARGKSGTGKSETGIWGVHYNAMARKTAIRRLLWGQAFFKGLQRVLAADGGVKMEIAPNMDDVPAQYEEGHEDNGDHIEIPDEVWEDS